MLSKLLPPQLHITISPDSLGFANTAELLQGDAMAGSDASWIGQPRAHAAASLGLRMQQPGYHMLVIGEPGSGRTSLVKDMVQQALAKQAVPEDLVYLLNFQQAEKPLLLRLKAGKGNELRLLLDQFSRRQLRTLPALVQSERLPKSLQATDAQQAPGSRVTAHLEEELAAIRKQIQDSLLAPQLFEDWCKQLLQEVIDNLDVFAPGAANEQEGMQEAFLGRLRANLLVSNAGLTGAPVIYDEDPSFASLFGGIESAGEHHVADFMRLKAGNLLRANGGVLILHLEDLLTDAQGANPLLDKLSRVLRNRKQTLDDGGNASGGGSPSALMPDALPVNFKLILVASREDYYHLHEQHPNFVAHFLIKIEFAESVPASQAIYAQLASHIARICHEQALPHFTAAAVVRVLQVMHGWVEDQARISLALGHLVPLLQESAAQAAPGQLVDVAAVEAALQAELSRHDYAEQQLRESILDGELMIEVQGREVGQINGLTHIDMGDVAFGSPVRISARCYPGRQGIINIDREVEMTGPQHDKGVFILQNWLASTFAGQAPLNLNASLVFEQEYNGVEGDSASCAELYALLSSLSGLPLPQGVAVTGALNQHGEVLPVGGINEKIEGHFRLCEKLGLDGKQGVLLPARNSRHLLLNRDVVQAVADGKFHIYAMTHVLDGIEQLTGMQAGTLGEEGEYRPDTVLGRVQRTLESYRAVYQRNRSKQDKPNE
ncbi:MAG: AAA family ATPase [Methylobacillus glycogenes]|nr:AAA family ATPase [Methylobacillus glycogenes]